MNIAEQNAAGRGDAVEGPDIEHNARGEYSCTECGHQGNGQVPGCPCVGCDDMTRAR